MTVGSAPRATLSLELSFVPPAGQGQWARYNRLSGQDAYDAWYLAHYGREIFNWRRLLRAGCTFDRLPRKEKALLAYLALAARPGFRSVLEVGSSLFEIIDALLLARQALGPGPIPAVAIERIKFLGLENSELLAYASQDLHPGHQTQIFPSLDACNDDVDLIYDRATAGMVFKDAASYAAALKRAKAGVLNLLVSRQEAFASSALDRPFVYFSLAELVDRLDGRLFHLFGERAPGIDRAQGRPVVEGFFLYGDADFARDFVALGRTHPQVAQFFADKKITARPARELVQ